MRGRQQVWGQCRGSQSGSSSAELPTHKSHSPAIRLSCHHVAQHDSLDAADQPDEFAVPHQRFDAAPMGRAHLQRGDTRGSSQEQQQDPPHLCPQASPLPAAAHQHCTPVRDALRRSHFSTTSNLIDDNDLSGQRRCRCSECEFHMTQSPPPATHPPTPPPSTSVHPTPPPSTPRANGCSALPAWCRAACSGRGPSCGGHCRCMGGAPRCLPLSRSTCPQLKRASCSVGKTVGTGASLAFGPNAAAALSLT